MKSLPEQEPYIDVLRRLATKLPKDWGVYAPLAPTARGISYCKGPNQHSYITTGVECPFAVFDILNLIKGCTVEKHVNCWSALALFSSSPMFHTGDTLTEAVMRLADKELNVVVLEFEKEEEK